MLLTTPTPHPEAAALVRGKFPATRAIFDAMLPDLRAASVVITGVEDLRVIERVRNLTAAIPEGEDWSAAKDKIIAEIEPWLADTEEAERRAELLLRSHAYAAYSTANYRALEEQSDIFTWKKYQTAQDERVRGTHRALDGIIAPANSPFWRAHTPPWDYGCRCDVVGLTDDDVEELRATGSTILDEEGKPAIQIIEPDSDELTALEEGHLFRDQTMHFVARDPDHYLYDPEGPMITVEMLEGMKQRVGPRAWDAFTDWARDAEVPGVGPVWAYLTQPPRKRAAKKAPARVTAAAARKNLALLKTEADDAETAINDLLVGQAGSRGFYDRYPDFRKDVDGLEDAYTAREAVVEKARLLIAVDPTATRPFEPHTKARKDRAILIQRHGEALDQWARMIGADKLKAMNARLRLRMVREAGGRAHYDLKGAVHMVPGNSVSVHMHEIAHWLEDASPELLKRSVAFLDRRTKNDKITFYNGSWKEPTKADKFWSDYCGRQYRKGGGTGDAYATEILSMGIERYTFDPIAFAAEDPGYFDFIYNTLRKPL